MLLQVVVKQRELWRFCRQSSFKLAGFWAGGVAGSGVVGCRGTAVQSGAEGRQYSRVPRDGGRHAHLQVRARHPAMPYPAQRSRPAALPTPST